jgi:hypothetical protein
MNDITFAFIFIFFALHVYIVFIDSRFDDRKFQDLLIDHIAIIRSSISIDQSTTLQRFLDDIVLNKNEVAKFKFDISDTSFIE